MELITRTELGKTGWVPSAQMEYEQWLEFGHQLSKVTRAVQWWWGDYLNYGEETYGEIFWQAVAELGLEAKTIKGWMLACSRVPQSVRREDLDFSHHLAVARLPVAEQEHWLQAAADEGMSVKDLRAAVKGDETPQDEPEWAPPPELIDFAHLVQDMRDAQRGGLKSRQKYEQRVDKELRQLLPSSDRSQGDLYADGSAEENEE